MRKAVIIAAIALPLLSGGCVAKMAFDVVSAPVKVAGKTADWATTSQDEADRNYGRKMRKQEAREGRDRKEAARRCRHDRDACGDYDGYRSGSD